MFKKLGSKLKEQKGFTLIELLAVIVILGIIAAIAIPAINNVIQKSDDKAAVQEGLLIISAAKMYVANNGETGDIDLSLNGGTVASVTTSSLKDYLDRVETDTFVVHVEEGSTPGQFTYSISNHPSADLAGAGTPAKASEQDLLDFGN
jgi:type IV pilus assembly protein PilA